MNIIRYSVGIISILFGTIFFIDIQNAMSLISGISFIIWGISFLPVTYDIIQKINKSNVKKAPIILPIVIPIIWFIACIIFSSTTTDTTPKVTTTVEEKDEKAESSKTDSNNKSNTATTNNSVTSKPTTSNSSSGYTYSSETTSQKNAVKKAKSYLEFTAFSRQGLIEQLEYEKFSYDDAVYGVDHCNANWSEQAVKKAKSYLEFMAFSRDGLIEQLEYEGFSYEEAVYGVEANGL